MACDPKKIYSDLQVLGVVLTYSNIWVAGTMKTLSTINTNTDLKIFTFRYKDRDFYNVFRYLSNDIQSGEIRAGLYNIDGDENEGVLIEKIDYV